jgi:hypothetical protein
MSGIELVREREHAEANAALNQGMSDLLRQDARRSHRSLTPTPSAAPLAQALSALDAAKATGDPTRIAQATNELDGVLDAARAAARPPAPDFGAGARPPAPSLDASQAFNAQLREDRLGWRH